MTNRIRMARSRIKSTSKLTELPKCINLILDQLEYLRKRIMKLEKSR